MPRAPLFKRKINAYVEHKRCQQRSEYTVHKYQTILLCMYDRLMERNKHLKNPLEFNPGKMGEREADEIVNVMKRSRYAINVINQYLQYYDNNVIKKLDIVWPKSVSTNITALERQMMDLVIEYATDDPTTELMVHLTGELGVRPIGCRRLRIQDIHDGYFNICDKGRMGGKWRIVSWDDERTPMILDRYMKFRQELIEKAKNHPKNKKRVVRIPEKFIIVQRGPRVQPYSKTALENKYIALERKMNEDGIPIKLTWYTLRHTLVDLLDEAEASWEEIAEVFDWEDPRTIKNYRSVKLKRKKKALAKLSVLKKTKKCTLEPPIQT